MFKRCWLYKLNGNDVQGLIVDNKDDYDLLVESGYRDHPDKARETKKEIEVKEEVNTDLPFEDIKKLKWNALRGHAKALELKLGVDIMRHKSGREDILNRIEEVLNGDSTAVHK